MKITLDHNSSLEDRVTRLEGLLEMADEEAFATQLVLSWLLARADPDDVHAFLALQAFDLERDGRHEVSVALFDALRDSAAQWRDQWRADQTRPRR